MLAWLSSITLLLLLRVESVPIYVALLAVASCFLWYGSYKLSGDSHQVSEDRSLPESSGTQAEAPHLRYFARLLASLNKNWLLCDSDLDQARGNLRNVHHALVDAIDAAKSTGMLAVNSMIAATNTGEVGRGFVTVSKDLVSISDQSGQDLAKMKDVIAVTEVRLSQARRLLDVPLLDYVGEPASSPIAELAETVACIQSGQEQLRIIAERYQRNSKSDVRWLQLGDAVRRLLNDVINVLYQFELRLIDVISDMRLLALSGTLTGDQLIEIKDQIDSGPQREATE